MGGTTIRPNAQFEIYYLNANSTAYEIPNFKVEFKIQSKKELKDAYKI
jgi:hypothetical protein